MKNLGKLLVGCTASCAIMAGLVNAKSPCGGSGFTIGAGFKFGKSQYELKSNKIKPVNERINDKVKEYLAPYQKKAKEIDDVVHSNQQNGMLEQIAESSTTGFHAIKAQLVGWKVGTHNIMSDDAMQEVVTMRNGPTEMLKGMYSLVKTTGTRCFTNKITGDFAAWDADFNILSNCDEIISKAVMSADTEEMGLYTNANGGAQFNVTTTLRISDCEKIADLVKGTCNNVDLLYYPCPVSDVANRHDGSAVNYSNLAYGAYFDDQDDVRRSGGGSIVLTPGQLANLNTIDISHIDSSDILLVQRSDVFSHTEFAGLSTLDSLVGRKGYYHKEQTFAYGSKINTDKTVSAYETVESVINDMEQGAQKIATLSHEAFSKSNIGQNYEKGDHWDGAIDLNLGWTQRFGDFSFYLGGILEIPVFKKEYQIKDKALADLNTTSGNTSNSDDKDKKNENNKFGYTFEKKLSFGASLMGYYNVTKMVSIGAGLNIWKKRGEFKYNDTAELYLARNNADVVKLVEACGMKVDEFDAEAKKAGYGDKSKKVSAWVLEPVLGVNFFINNFNISVKFGYQFNRKFMKDNFELSGNGFTFALNFSYTLPMF